MVEQQSRDVAFFLTIRGLLAGRVYHAKVGREMLTVGQYRVAVASGSSAPIVGGPSSPCRFAIFGYSPQPSREEVFDHPSDAALRLFELTGVA